MPDPVVTQIDQNRGVGFEDPVWQDETFTAAGAGTTPAGTILARSTASGKLILYVKGGSTDGNGVPVAVLSTDLVAAGAGDVFCRPVVKGQVAKTRLVIAADGDNSNIDKAVQDLLRGIGILVREDINLAVQEGV